MVGDSFATKIQKAEAQKRKQAKERAARELATTIQRFGLNKRQPSGGITPDPLIAKSFVRRPNSPLPRTAYQDWRREAICSMRTNGDAELQRKKSTIKEMQLKRARIAPAYNKGALQYLPRFDKSD